MAEKIAQTMQTLAEDNRDIKTSLRLMLKYEVQSLLDRLADLGEDSLLIFANSNEGTSSCNGTPHASSFLSTCNTNYNLNLKDTFLKYCVSCTGNTTSGMSAGMMSLAGDQQTRGDSMWQDMSQPAMRQNMAVGTMNQQGQMGPNLQSLITKQPKVGSNNRFSPYNQNSNMNNNNMGANNMGANNMGSNMSFNQSKYSMWGNNDNSGSVPSLLSQALPSRNNDHPKRNTDVCRHYARGLCWQGNLCAFLHTKDPVLLAKFEAKNKFAKDSGKCDSNHGQEPESSSHAGSSNDNESSYNKD